MKSGRIGGRLGADHGTKRRREMVGDEAEEGRRIGGGDGDGDREAAGLGLGLADGVGDAEPDVEKRRWGRARLGEALTRARACETMACTEGEESGFCGEGVDCCSEEWSRVLRKDERVSPSALTAARRARR